MLAPIVDPLGDLSQCGASIMDLDQVFDVLVVYCKVHLDEGVSSKKMEVINNSITRGLNNKDDVVIVLF